MEISQNKHNQSNDNSFKNESLNKSQPNMTLLNQIITNPYKKGNIDDVIQNSQEKDSSKKKRNSYIIILRTSIDKNKNRNEKKVSQLNLENSADNTSENQKVCSKKQNTLNINEQSKNDEYEKYNIIQNEDEIKNKANVHMVVEHENNNNFDYSDIKTRNKDIDSYKNEDDNNVKNEYYNPFYETNKNEGKLQTQQNINSCNEEKKYLNKKGKIPNITLTTFQTQTINTDGKDSNSSWFLNLFTNKKNEKEVQKKEETKEGEGMKSNALMTLEEKIKDKSNVANKNKNQKKEDNNIRKEKYDFGLNMKSSKSNKEEKNNAMKEEINDEQDKEESNKQLNNNINNYNFIIKAEPIMNNNNKEDVKNILNIENNISSSEQMKDIDNSSEYSYLSGKSIIELIRKKSKCSALLLAVLFGSCGLFYLLYKKMNLKELFSKISGLAKLVPGLFNNIFSIFSGGLEDFMERYNDVFRLLIGLIIFISLWFVAKLYIKKYMKIKINKF